MQVYFVSTFFLGLVGWYVHLSSSELKSRAAIDSFSQAPMNFTLKTGLP